MLTSVLIGSEPNLAAQTITVTVDGNPQPIVFPAGAWYLDHDDSTLDLLSELSTLLSAHPEAPTVSCYLTEGGLVRIDVSAAATFSITWGTATDLQQILGFTGNLTGALTYTAQNPSPLIWIPRRTEISAARLGTQGDPVYDTAVGMPAGSGAPVATQHNVRYENQFEWRHVVNSTEAGVHLVRSASGTQNGKWYGFHERVVRRFARFVLFREVNFTAGGTAAMVFGTVLGPYVWRAPASAVRYVAPREEEMREAYNRVTLPVVLVDEYD